MIGSSNLRIYVRNHRALPVLHGLHVLFRAKALHVQGNIARPAHVRR